MKKNIKISYQNIEKASQLLANIVNKTPVMTSRTINQITGNQIFFKCENFQRAGAFKIRGAYNAMFHAKNKEILSYSSGNHAQAVALSAQLIKKKATIIMPSDAPKVKIEATKKYGAKVVIYDRNTTTREELAKKLATKLNATIIPPYDHKDIISGQGTVAKEFFEEVGDLDYLLVPCGGGGLLSGSALTAGKLSPNCKVIGIEPEMADDAFRSFVSKKLQHVHNPQTIADGARTPSLGKITFPLILEHVHDIKTVSETKIREGMFYLWERMKIIVEPTGALGMAFLLQNKLSMQDKKIGVIISGGNITIPRDFL